MPYSLDSLRRAAEALPPEGSLVLPREAFLEALGPEAPSATDHSAPDRRQAVKKLVAEAAAPDRQVLPLRKRARA